MSCFPNTLPLPLCQVPRGRRQKRAAKTAFWSADETSALRKGRLRPPPFASPLPTCGTSRTDGATHLRTSVGVDLGYRIASSRAPWFNSAREWTGAKHQIVHHAGVPGLGLGRRYYRSFQFRRSRRSIRPRATRSKQGFHEPAAIRAAADLVALDERKHHPRRNHEGPRVDEARRHRRIPAGRR